MDKKELYEVNDEYEESNEYENDPGHDGKFQIKYVHNSRWRLPAAIMFLILAMALLLIIILQAVTLAHLNLLPVICPEADPTTPSTSTNAPITGNCDDNDDSDEDTAAQAAFRAQTLAQLNQLINTSRDILTVSDGHFQFSQNSTKWLVDLLNATKGSAQKLTEIADALSDLKNTSVSTGAIANDILSVAKELSMLVTVTHSPVSCQDILTRNKSSMSGYYEINGQFVYCEMNDLCEQGGGWTRLGFLNMSDSSMECPDEYQLYTFSGIRACGRPSAGDHSCVSVILPSHNIQYSAVCGRVTGYQYATPNAVSQYNGPGHDDIDSVYVDGVSITRGSNPRKHVWTLMAGISGSVYDPGNCPCNAPPGSDQDLQSFIGNDYFCESGNGGSVAYKWFPDDALWDGQDCGTQELNCCAASGLPWFYKSFDTTDDYLEVRECGDQSAGNEDNPISFYEIYVR